MTEFNDPDLRQSLGRLSGPYPDDNAAFAAWQRRVGQARRRRVVAWTTAAALSLIVGTVAVAALQSPQSSSLVPGKSADPSTDVSVSSTVAETDASVTTTSTPTSSTESPTDRSTSVAATNAAETTPTSEAVETSVPDAQPPAAGGTPSGGTTKGHSSSPTTVATPTTQPATQTFESAGGSITVHLENDELTVVATHATHGFHADQNRSGHEVQVTFRSGDERYEIAVRVTNGVMKSTVTDRSDRHDSTVPDDTSDSGHGDWRGGGGNG